MISTTQKLRAVRLYKRLLEVARDFDNSPYLKALLVKPVDKDPPFPYLNKVFGNGSFYVPFSCSTSPFSFQTRSISFIELSKQYYRSMNDNETNREAYWDVMRQLLNVLTYAENNNISGLIDDHNFVKYSGKLVQQYVARSKERLSSNSTNITLADNIEPGVSLVAHPMLPNQYWRNTVIHLLDYNSQAASGVIVNFLRKYDDDPSAYLEGGQQGKKVVLSMFKSNGEEINYSDKPEESDFAVSDVETEHLLAKKSDLAPDDDTDTDIPSDTSDAEPEEYQLHKTINGITFTTRHVSSAEQKKYEIRQIFGRTLWGPNQIEKEIEKGCWIPVKLDEKLLLEPFQTESGNISLSDTLKVRRLYWEEVLRSMGGEYESISLLSSTYRRYY